MSKANQAFQISANRPAPYDLSETVSAQPNQRLHTRSLDTGDAQQFRIVRLEAISKTNVFVSLFPSEAGVPPQQTEAAQPLVAWEALLVPTEHSSFFGVFAGERLIAISLVHAALEDTSGKSVGMGAAYVLDDFRKRGVLTLLFEAMSSFSLSLSTPLTLNGGLAMTKSNFPAALCKSS